MDRTYLQEAFHAMELLEEDEFTLDDVGIKDILDFKDHDELNDIVDVVDPEAETEEEVKDSYIGDVILECEVCHSPIFKHVEDIEVSEDGELVNIEEECPICHSNDGFKIIGQVAPYQEDPELKVEIEDKPEDEVEDEVEDTVEDTVEEPEDEEDVDESLNEANLFDRFGNIEHGGKLTPATKFMQAIYKFADGDTSKEITTADLKEIARQVGLADQQYQAFTKNLLQGGFLSAQGDSGHITDKLVKYVGGENKHDFNFANESLTEELDPELAEKLDEIEDKIEEVAEQVCPKCEDEETAEEIEDAVEDEIEDAAEEEIVEESCEVDEAKDLSTVDGSVTKALLDVKADLDNATSVAEVKEVVHAALDGMTAPGAKKVLANVDAKSALMDLISYIWNVILSGTGNASIEHEFHEDCAGDCEDKEELDEGHTNKVSIEGGTKNFVTGDPVDWKNRKKETRYQVVDKNGETVAKYDTKEDAEKDIKAFKKEDKRNHKDTEYTIKEITESLREGFEKVDLEMEDKIIHVSEEQKEPVPDAEMIVPVSDELESELTEPVAEDEETVEEPMIDEPMMEEPALEEAPLEDEEDVDYDVDEFDEEDFDDLGESYLKKVYENVDSFKTTEVRTNDSQLIIEGMIKFTSGKEKKTQFIFEAQDATKEGQVRFIGENCQISRGKKAFTLSGKMEGSKFIAESLNYNYRANSNRVYGTVKTNK